MNIGVICSSSGSTFKAFWEILKKNNRNFNFFIITDRKCNIINLAKKNKIPFKVIDEDDNTVFSAKAKEEFERFGGVDFIILFYSRLVTADLFKHYLVFNLHPSLLPAFQGFNPIKKALKSGAKYCGTTLHIVDESVDNGPIVAQGIIPIVQRSTPESLERKSYVQKVYLLLLLIDFYENKAVKLHRNNITFEYATFPTDKVFNPALKNKSFLKDVIDLDRKNGSAIFKQNA